MALLDSIKKFFSSSGKVVADTSAKVADETAAGAKALAKEAAEAAAAKKLKDDLERAKNEAEAQRVR